MSRDGRTVSVTEEHESVRDNTVLSREESMINIPSRRTDVCLVCKKRPHFIINPVDAAWIEA